jgi:nucleoside-diphosphate-sugar epimerase
MVLVTGGTGFLGAYIIKHLIEKGHNVRALRRAESKLPFFIPTEILDKVEWVEGDVLDIISLQDAMEGIDAIIHAAGIVSFSADKKKNMFQVNVDGTANIVNVALEKNIRRIIHISSVAALGRTESGEWVTEAKEWNNSKLNTDYAISKHKSEMEIWRGIAEGLEGAILNPGIILGYGDWNNTSCAIFKTVYKEFPWYSTGVNGFVYVEDVARAAVTLLESNINGERFIINGDNWSYQQLFNTIADGFGKKRPQRKVTPFLAMVALFAEKIKTALNGKASILTRETARIAQNFTYYDNSKITKALPDFPFTPLDIAIKESCALFTASLSSTIPEYV